MASNYSVPSVKDLLDAGVHFGHQLKRWHPAMEPYIYTVKKDIHIIDLEETERLLKEACDFLYQTAAEGGKIIFVGTKKQAAEIVELEAKRSGALFVNQRWLGGTLTNLETIKKIMAKLTRMLKDRQENKFTKYTKKEKLLIDREIEKLQKSVGGIVSMTTLPAAIFVIDAKREKTAIKEAKSAKVKVVGLVDTNSSPAGVDLVIPGNDDGLKAIALILKAVADAVEAGYSSYAQKVAKGEVSSGQQNLLDLDEQVTAEALPLIVTGSESSVVTQLAPNGLKLEDAVELAPKVDITLDVEKPSLPATPKKLAKAAGVKKPAKRAKA